MSESGKRYFSAYVRLKWVLIHSADPKSRPVKITISKHIVHPSVLTFSNSRKTDNVKVKIVSVYSGRGDHWWFWKSYLTVHTQSTWLFHRALSRSRILRTVGFYILWLALTVQAIGDWDDKGCWSSKWSWYRDSCGWGRSVLGCRNLPAVMCNLVNKC